MTGTMVHYSKKWWIQSLVIGALAAGNIAIVYTLPISLSLIAAVIPAYALCALLAIRRREQQSVVDNEELFRSAMEHAAIGMALISTEGRWLRVNDALCSFLGYSRDEMASIQLRDIIHPDDINSDLVRGRDLAAGNINSYQREKRYIRKDGSVVWGLLVASAVRSQRGAFRFFIMQIENIDRRKRMDEALRISEERWQFALEGSAQGVWDWNDTDNLFFLSNACKRVLGYEEHELTGGLAEWSRHIHPDDMKEVKALVRAHLKGRTPYYESEHRMRCKDGSYKWTLQRGMVIERDATGRAVRMVGTQTDNTTVREAEQTRIRLAERAALAIQAGRLGIWEWDVDSGELVWDARMYELYDLQPDSGPMDMERWRSYLVPTDAARTYQEAESMLLSSTSFDAEFRVQRANGELRYLRATATTVRDASGRPVRVVGTNWDISEMKNISLALQEEKERLQVTLSSIADAVITTDDHARIIFMNPVAEALTGWTLDECRGQPIEDVFCVIDSHTEQVLCNPVRNCLATRQVCHLENEATLIDRRGQRRDIHDSAAPVQTAAGAVIGAVLVFQNVTEDREQQRKLTFSASHDALTGLANRAHFERELNLALAGSQADGTAHVLCFIDLDRFKIVNDSAGHAAGDRLLCELSALIQHEIRSSDFLARLGGDEFGLLLRNCTIEKGEKILGELLERINAFRFLWNQQVYDIGASIGITPIAALSPAIGELMGQADIACYSAKHGGRNQIAIFREDHSQDRQQRQELFLASGIRRAVEQNRFVLHAQPIVPTADAQGIPTRYELLLRMLSPGGDMLPPGAFMPPAERFGLMLDIDRWVLKEVLQRCASQIAAVPDLRLSLNVSVNSLGDPLFLPYLLDLLEHSLINPAALTFEITENALLNQYTKTERVVGALRERGCRVALDDFGTGLNSFHYLKSFRVDAVKIDGSFFHNLTTDVVDRAIVASVRNVAQQVGVETIAKSVESRAALELLRDIGIDYAQGYAIARPEPFQQLLLQRKKHCQIIPFQGRPKK